MTGLMYKELRQNRKYLIMTALIAPVCMLFFMLMVMLPGSASEGGASALADLLGKASGDQGAGISLVHMYCALISFLFGGLASLTFFKQDEIKKWGYFTASHPKGIKGAVYSKYVLVAFVGIISFVSVTLTEELITLLDHLILGTEMKDIQSYSMLYIILFFLQLFLRMIDIPFLVRFGHRQGEKVKVMTIGGIFIGGFIYALFGPLPEGEGGDFFISLYDWWTEFSFGKGAMWLYFGIAVFLWITIIGYYLSYRLSCKLYLKGVELYDK